MLGWDYFYGHTKLGRPFIDYKRGLTRAQFVFGTGHVGEFFLRNDAGVVSESFTVKDFGGVETGAIEHVADFVNIWEAGEASHEVEDLADVLEDLLNLHALIGSTGRGNLDIPANKVLVTKRRVILPLLGLDNKWSWGINRADEADWHAALKYSLAETYGPTNISANPTNAAYQRSGLLVSERNNLVERNNLFAGTVIALSVLGAITVWGDLVRKEISYCDELDYADPRETNHEQDEYNSNWICERYHQFDWRVDQCAD